MKEISAGGVVYRRRDGRTEIQLISDRFGKITLAKGKREAGETIEQTALREIREETGISGRIVTALPVVAYQYDSPERGTVQKEVHYFLVEASEGDLRAQTEEIAGVGWYAPDEAWKRQRGAGYRNNDEVLRQAFERLGLATEESGRFPLWVPGEPIAPFIDHTLLRADARAADIGKLCEEAAVRGFYSVCVSGGWVRLCREKLTGTPVKVCAVVGSPLGAGATRAKAFEAAAAVEDGAAEIDMALPIGPLLDGDREAVEKQVAAVVQAVQGGALVKVILEAGALTDERKAEGCRIAEAAGADYIVTSIGFGPGGATEADVRLMRGAVSGRMGVKASGGIRDYETAARLLAAGANRIGTSAGLAIAAGGGAPDASAD
jgi:deoxyribose-phosphate aldolase